MDGDDGAAATPSRVGYLVEVFDDAQFLGG